LGQPIDGVVPAVCRKCGQRRGYPAVLDDLDPPAEPAKSDDPESTATAVGGARPSPVASSPAAAPSPVKPVAVATQARTRRAATTAKAPSTRVKASLSVD